MFFRVAVGEAKSSRLAVESSQLIYPSSVYPGSETPAAVIVVEVGILEFAFDKNISQLVEYSMVLSNFVKNPC